MSNCRCSRWTAFLRNVLFASMVLLLLLPAQQASAGQAGWDALKAGTAFVIMRHALAPGTGDPENIDLSKCETQRNLSDRGRQQARETGTLFRNNGIAAADVFSSAWCRCRDTARLLALGAVETLEPLNSFFGRQDRRQARLHLLACTDRVPVSNSPRVRRGGRRR